MTYLHNSVRILKRHDYKITAPRTAVLEVFASSDSPLSAYDVEGRIRKEIPVTVVTIYRILEVFEKLGLVHRIHTKEGYIRCDFEAEDGCHYFAVCTKCGRATEFLHKKACLLEAVVPENLHFKELGHIAEISGVCEKCLENL